MAKRKEEIVEPVTLEQLEDAMMNVKILSAQDYGKIRGLDQYNWNDILFSLLERYIKENKELITITVKDKKHIDTELRLLKGDLENSAITEVRPYMPGIVSSVKDTKQHLINHVETVERILNEE